MYPTVEYMVISPDGDAPDWYENEVLARYEAEEINGQLFEVRKIADFRSKED